MATALFRQRWLCVPCNKEIMVTSKAKHLVSNLHLKDLKNRKSYITPPTNQETKEQKDLR